MKYIFDYSHVKSVSAWALLDKTTKEPRGKIIANWSDNPNGSVCTVQVIFFDDTEKLGLKTAPRKHFKTLAPLIGKAGGSGYCKFSSAVYEALRPVLHGTEKPIAGVGEGAVRDFLDTIGLEAFIVI